ncbi:hypothetical protein BU23DRAFT_194672 [Bimuria novae-zelandiae CBS 107.79]|uniref:Uncharacterized protein n=1 Tax=Bimuria novae-zelandiae CBS 107.79 TaxID=1447943 RepID=A0A6A5V4Z2_9PLEO|nr:hypothetical protein BU23DRAFT_194672 [Bimuria novae-zelandiae CBS 107.79]
MAALQLRRMTMREDAAGNAERSSPLRIEVTETVAVYVEQHGLPTPPPSPVPAELFISRSESTTLRPDSKTCEALRCSILDITVSERCIVHARVLAQWATQHGKLLRLITMDWKDFSHYWGLQLQEHIGKTAYDIAERLSSGGSGAGMVLLAERDLCDVGLSLEDCKSLLDGFSLYISRRVVLADIPWMSSCEGCHHN